jgi:tetratricopeptide (TPR) repeat protein
MTLRLTILLALLVALTVPAHADQFARRNNTGNKLLKEGQIDSAITEYRAARVERPDQPGVVYNLGSAYHQKGVFDTAQMELQNAIAHVEPMLKPNAYYNLGNTFYRMQEYESAIEAYKQALLANPSDLDAKHNLEMALRQMNQQDSSSQKQEQKQDQQQQDSTGQQQQNQQQQNQDSTRNQQQQQQNQDGNQDQQQQQQQPDQPREGQPREQRQPKPVQGMTRADAERLLDALKNNELALQKKRAQRTTGEKVAKDW